MHELQAGAEVLVSPVVYFELRRGLTKRKATRLIAFLDSLIATLIWIEFTRSDWEAAADLWAQTQQAGRPRGDADILIAAQANRRGAIVVTHNVKHFDDISVGVETWP